MQPAHALCGLDIHRVLRLDFQCFVPRHKTKQLDVFVQIFQVKSESFAGSKPLHPKTGEVAFDDELRQVALGNAREIVQRLRQRFVQVFAARFVLHQQHAGPEQVDVAIEFCAVPRQFLNRMFKAGNALVGDAKYFEKVDPEGLGLAAFIGGVSPGSAERQRAGFDFIPA